MKEFFFFFEGNNEVAFGRSKPDQDNKVKNPPCNIQTQENKDKKQTI
mgnify:CR=1 FL=1